MRRYTFLFAASIFLVVCYLLYNSLEASNTRKKEYYERGKGEINRLEEKLRLLENDLQKNDLLISDVRDKLYKVIGGSNNIPSQPASFNQRFLSKGSVGDSNEKDVCSLVSQHSVPDSDVQMLDVYDILPFDNPDGGAWKQGWNIEYNKESIEKEPRLQVILVPHSHCDPGWIKTFEKYYQDQTRKILNSMLTKLSAERQASFIFAEMSFFERWWRDIDDVKRNAVRRIIENGQFEVVTGGWVMTDEANSHYFAMIDQLIEGHQFLEHQLNFRPKSHWSIDPFGLSSTMAYLIGRSNLTAMAIQRVHYSVKKYLAKNKQLEFMWRQLWAGSNSGTDILCHTFPFYSYDVPHTCGPEPKVCCTFDFKRLPGGGVNCPWNEPPVAITEYNVEQRASVLLDQYRKKSQLYKTNVLLVPLGDDFRYDSTVEWDNQFNNYQKLFDYMNSKKELNVKASFGTLSDYFTLLKSQSKGQSSDFPVLTGDFFTYADRDDHYWSGYYTSRPFYKRMDRSLQHYLRTAEISFSLSLGLLRKHQSAGFPFEELFQELVSARRNLGLFQHHDGITGTAKDPVVVDYGQKMFQSIEGCKMVISACTHFMISADKPSFKTETNSLAFEIEEVQKAENQVPTKAVIKISSNPRPILIFNSLGQIRSEIICLHVDGSHLDVKDSKNQSLTYQINPVFDTTQKTLKLTNDVFEVCFEVSVPPLGISHYSIHSLSSDIDSKPKTNIKSNIKILSDFFSASDLDGKDIIEESPHLTVGFDGSTGFLKSIKPRGGEERSVQLEFVKYGARRKGEGGIRGGDSLSGAYLFLPNGPAHPLPSDKNQIVIMSGQLLTTVLIKTTNFIHQVVVKKTWSLDAQSLTISNKVDITEEYNFELAMRLKTNVRNGQLLFTDLNGLQMIKRKRQEKIPLQGNIYPMPSSAYLEDENYRLTLVSAQPLGVGSLEEGWIEVILDRRLMQDDDRGLFQGVTDNKLTPDYFKLVFEALRQNSAQPKEFKIGYHTLLGHYSSLNLLYPLVPLYAKEIHANAALNPDFVGLSKPLPCDVHLVNLRTLQEPDQYGKNEPRSKPKKEHGLILHRFIMDCNSITETNITCTTENENISLDMFDQLSVESAEQSTLTMMYTKRKLTENLRINLEPMDLSTFKITLK